MDSSECQSIQSCRLTSCKEGFLQIALRKQKAPTAETSGCAERQPCLAWLAASAPLGGPTHLMFQEMGHGLAGKGSLGKVPWWECDVRFFTMNIYIFIQTHHLDRVDTFMMYHRTKTMHMDTPWFDNARRYIICSTHHGMFLTSPGTGWNVCNPSSQPRGDTQSRIHMSPL